MKLSALSKYNKPENILIVSNYPTFDSSGEMGNINGVSTYTYNLVSKLKDTVDMEDRKIIILADKVNISNNSKKNEDIAYEENGVLVVRCWKKDDPFIFNRIVKISKLFSNVDKIFIHFEFNMYGNILTTLLFPRFLYCLREKKKNITVLLHQVVKDLSELSGHLDVDLRSIKMSILNFGIRKFYWMIIGIANKIIVHDNIFKDRLSSIRIKNPVFVIPHGMVDNADYCEIVDPRERLGLKKKDFLVLVFGFLTWYKGSDWVAKQFADYYKKTGDESIKLVLAGGESANLKYREFYKKYYSKLLRSIEGCKNIIHTGFVPDDLIRDYYCAADVVVFPYRTHMSASGPFSLCLSFDRPFLMSDNLSSCLDTSDIKEVIRSLDIKKDDLVFSLKRPGDLFDKISKLVESKRRRDLMSSLSESIKNEREWGKTSRRLMSIIDA